MRTKAFIVALAAVLLSAAPANAATVSVELDPGNPYDDVPQVNVDNVAVTLSDAQGNRTTLHTVNGKVDFGELADGRYTLSFPENPEYRTSKFEVPVKDPKTGAELAGVIIYPKPEQPAPTVQPGPTVQPTTDRPTTDRPTTQQAQPTTARPTTARPTTQQSQPTQATRATQSTQATRATQAKPSTESPAERGRSGILASTGSELLWLIAGGVLLFVWGALMVGPGGRRQAENAHENQGDRQ
ncbi:hypothetical protein [Corynebacterium riegelii]|uniref:hypothetical protein n=1 Tax=Corynebacterium riegelii TaxID=156976 RepID=UPI002889C231|nr:hypothetical protein [Corynebacterium riegelii]